jgi:hypothetical protein
MTPRKLNRQEKQTIHIALEIRKNLIQTGNPNLSAVDVQNMGAEKAKKRFGAEIQALSTDQMKMIILSEELVTAALQDRLMIIE